MKKITHDSGSLECAEFLANLKSQKICSLAPTAVVQQVYAALSETWGPVQHSGIDSICLKSVKN